MSRVGAAHNYTDQLRDSSRLLYYHARYYNPTLGRFWSPDSVVLGVDNSNLDSIARPALTMSFHETALLARLHSENMVVLCGCSERGPHHVRIYPWQPLRQCTPMIDL